MRIFILTLLFLNPANLYSAKNPYDNVEVENFITFMKEKHNYNEKKLRSLFEQITPESRLTKFFKKAPERTPMLKQLYEEEFLRAMSQDEERASFRVSPDLRSYNSA